MQGVCLLATLACWLNWHAGLVFVCMSTVARIPSTEAGQVRFWIVGEVCHRWILSGIQWDDIRNFVIWQVNTLTIVLGLLSVKRLTETNQEARVLCKMLRSTFIVSTMARRVAAKMNVPAVSTSRSFASVGDKIPSGVELHQGFPPKKYSVSDFCKDKSVILLGLPGAFTPTWSTKQIPNYKENQDALRQVGIDAVIVYCVNDAAVMQAWAKDQKVGLVRVMCMRMCVVASRTLWGYVCSKAANISPPAIFFVGFDSIDGWSRRRFN